MAENYFVYFIFSLIWSMFVYALITAAQKKNNLFIFNVRCHYYGEKQDIKLLTYVSFYDPAYIQL